MLIDTADFGDNLPGPVVMGTYNESISPPPRQVDKIDPEAYFDPDLPMSD